MRSMMGGVRIYMYSRRLFECEKRGQIKKKHEKREEEEEEEPFYDQGGASFSRDELRRN